MQPLWRCIDMPDCSNNVAVLAGDLRHKQDSINFYQSIIVLNAMCRFFLLGLWQVTTILDDNNSVLGREMGSI